MSVQLSRQDSIKVMRLWAEAEGVLTVVLKSLMEEYTRNMSRQDTEWETLRQSIEYTAKRQALVDLQNILKQNYAG